MVDLVALLQAAQDRNRVLDARLTHQHRQETPLKGRVLLDVLLVLVQRRGADAVQFAARQCGLEHVGRIHRTFGATSTDQGVELVDEQHDGPLAACNLFQHGFQALFELAAVLGAGQQCTDVERHDALVFQAFRHIARDDAQGEAFGDRGLAHTRITNQHRVVLATTRQHLHDAPDLRVTADDGVELALRRGFRQVTRVLGQSFKAGFGIVGRDFAVTAHLGQRGFNALRAQATRGEQARDIRTTLLAERHEYMFGRHILIAHLARELLRFEQRLIQGT